MLFFFRPGKEYRFKVRGTKYVNSQLELIKVYKEYLGNDANIVVEYVYSVPLLYHLGKKKKCKVVLC